MNHLWMIVIYFIPLVPAMIVHQMIRDNSIRLVRLWNEMTKVSKPTALIRVKG